MINLSVNINKVATLRNSRDINVPDLRDAVEICIRCGCQGITVHPRLDHRHIRLNDLPVIKKAIRHRVEYNIECDPANVLVRHVLKIKPTQCTLVPTAPGEVTSTGGFDLKARRSELAGKIRRIKAAGIRVSLFLNAELEQVRVAREIGADAVELYTGTYAFAARAAQDREYRRLAAAAELAASLGLRVHAGHDLTLENLGRIVRLPGLAEVSIGHHLLTYALFQGIEPTIGKYLRILAR